MSEYVNGLQVYINEVVTLDFRENNQTQNGSVVRVVMLYDCLKQIHNVIGDIITQHDEKLLKLKKATN